MQTPPIHKLLENQVNAKEASVVRGPKASTIWNRCWMSRKRPNSGGFTPRRMRNKARRGSHSGPFQVGRLWRFRGFGAQRMAG